MRFIAPDPFRWRRARIWARSSVRASRRSLFSFSPLSLFLSRSLSSRRYSRSSGREYSRGTRTNQGAANNLRSFFALWRPFFPVHTLLLLFGGVFVVHANLNIPHRERVFSLRSHYCLDVILPHRAPILNANPFSFPETFHFESIRTVSFIKIQNNKVKLFNLA